MLKNLKKVTLLVAIFTPITLAMFFSCGAFADAPTYLEIGAAGIVDNNGDAYSDSSISWDETSKTLTLNNYDYLPIQICREDLVNSDVNLVLTGENRIREENVSGVVSFVSCPHLVISGEGSLGILEDGYYDEYTFLKAKNGFTLTSGTIFGEFEIAGDTTIDGGYFGGAVTFPTDGTLDKDIKLAIEDGKVLIGSSYYSHYESDKRPRFSLEINGGDVILGEIGFYNGYANESSYVINDGNVNVAGRFTHGQLTVNGGKVTIAELPDIEVTGGEVVSTKEFNESVIEDLIDLGRLDGRDAEQDIREHFDNLECGILSWENVKISGGSLTIAPYCSSYRVGSVEIEGGVLNASELGIGRGGYVQKGGEVNIIGKGITVGKGREGSRDRAPTMFLQDGGKLTVDSYNPDQPAIYVDIGYAMFNGGETNITGGMVPLFVEFPGDSGIDPEQMKQDFLNDLLSSMPTEDQFVAMCGTDGSEDYKDLNDDIAGSIEFIKIYWNGEFSRTGFTSAQDCRDNVWNFVTGEYANAYAEAYVNMMMAQQGGIIPPKVGGVAFNDGDVTLNSSTNEEMASNYASLFCPYWNLLEDGFQSQEECVASAQPLLDSFVLPIPLYVVRTLTSEEYSDGVDPSTLSTDESAIQISEDMKLNPEKAVPEVIELGSMYLYDSANGATLGDGEGEARLVPDLDNNRLISEHIPASARIYKDVPPVPDTDDDGDEGEASTDTDAPESGFNTIENNNYGSVTISSYAILASVLVGVVVGIVSFRKLSRR